MVRSYLSVLVVAFLVACGPAPTVEEPQARSAVAPTSADAPAPSVASAAVASAKVEQALTVASASAAPSASAPVPTAAPAASEKLVQDAVAFDFGPFPRKLTAKEIEFLGAVWFLADRQDALTLLAHSTTKQNAEAWLTLLGNHLIAAGVDESKLTKLACVDPKATRISSHVRKSPATCADVMAKPATVP